MKGKIAALAVVLMMTFALVGCMSPADDGGTKQQENRAYMSQVNEIMSQVNGALDGFVSSVSDDDIVSIRSTANDALRELAKLSSIEAPEDLTDIQTDYQDGSEKLSDALNQYVQIYSDLEGGFIDQATANERIAEVQSLYDEGYASLKQADEAAAAL